MLTAKQEKCAQLLAESNLTQREIAARLKVSEQTVCKWKKDDEFLEYVKKCTLKLLGTAGAKALRVQIGLLDAKSEMVRHSAAKDLLDRAGIELTAEADGGESNAADRLNEIFGVYHADKKTK